MVMLVISTLSGVFSATRSRSTLSGRGSWRYRCHALVLDEGGDFLLEDEQSPREAGRHDDKAEGQGEPQMELLEEFAYSHNSVI